MTREIMQQSLKLLIAYQDCTMDSYITNKCGLTIQALKQELAKPEQAEPLSPVDIGVDVTPEGTHVVAFYNRPDAVQEMFYSQFHPLAKPEQEPFKPDWVNYRQGLADGAAQPEQEPVCDKDPSLCGFVQCQLGKACKNTPINTMPTKIFGPNLEQILNAAGFYKRDWVGLTDDEMFDAMDSYSELENGRKIEQLLKEKNT
jgi:hypothetical protein